MSQIGSGLLGLGDNKEGSAGGNGGAAAGSTSATQAKSATGVGGAGGQPACLPGQQVACYTGPQGTEHTGVCHVGTQFCDESGMPGPCQGDVVPVTEICGNGLDDNCDGQADENCDCTPNAVENCYSGPVATDGVGVCHHGTHTCNADGHGYGTCTGEVPPAAEDCSTVADENCNNAELTGVDTASGCVCVPASTQHCYDGVPASTEGTGPCKGGMSTCQTDGLSWGACAGETVPLTEDCTMVGDEDCSGSGCSDTIWANGYHVAGGDVTAYSTAFDNQGNVFIALNNAGGSLTIGTTALSNRFIVAKLNSLGVVQWVRGYSTGGFGNNITGLASDGTNLYFTGYAMDSAVFGTTTIAGLFLAKIDGTGTEQWARSCGGTGGQGGHVAIDASGNVYFTGGVTGAASCGGAALTGSSSYLDVLVAKVASNNTLVWSKRYSGTAASIGSGVAANAAGEVYLDGAFSGSLSFGGTAHASAGGADMFVVKLSSANPPVQSWFNSYGDSGGQSFVDLKLDSGGNVFVGGSYNSQVTIGGMTYGSSGVIVSTALVAKLNSLGVVQWVKSFGGTSSTVNALAIDSTDHLVLTGAAGGFGGGTLGGGVLTGTYIGKLTNAGAHVWSKSYSSEAFFLGLAIGPADVIGVSGYYNDANVDVGTGPLPGSSGNQSGLIMEVGP